MNKLIKEAEKIEKLVQVHFDPQVLSKATEAIIKEELGIDAIVYHDFEDVEQQNNYYLVLTNSEFNDGELEQVEALFSAQIDSVYEMTLAIMDRLFDGYAQNSYVKLIDSMVYDDSPIVVEFAPEDYEKFLKSNN